MSDMRQFFRKSITSPLAVLVSALFLQTTAQAQMNLGGINGQAYAIGQDAVSNQITTGECAVISGLEIVVVLSALGSVIWSVGTVFMDVYKDESDGTYEVSPPSSTSNLSFLGNGSIKGATTVSCTAVEVAMEMEQDQAFENDRDPTLDYAETALAPACWKALKNVHFLPGQYSTCDRIEHNTGHAYWQECKEYADLCVENSMEVCLADDLSYEVTKVWSNGDKTKAGEPDPDQGCSEYEEQSYEYEQQANDDEQQSYEYGY